MRQTAFFLLAAGVGLAQSPTFYKDVAPVLEQHCQTCHRPGEVAPMPLLSYSEARPWAKAIKTAVLSHKMPPWYADPHVGTFSNNPSLSQAEIDTLVKWADNGAPEGNPADASAPRKFTEGWTIGKPDQVLDIGTDFKVPAKGTIEYTYFVVPTGFTEDRWVKEIEVRAGNSAVVHHVVLYARPKGSKFIGEAKPGVPYVPPADPGPGDKRPPQSDQARFYGINNGGYEMVGVYVPGGVAYRTRPGQARLIPAGADLIFQMHYTANGHETTDRSKVGIVFATEKPKERVVNAFILNETLRIPPGAENHRVDANVTLQADATLQAMFPHMHLRGKAFEYVATFPSGETQALLKVPQYSFNWQLTYYLDQPIKLPKGTVLKATAYYDNSPNNPYNPDPKKEVYWGDQSWDEMLAGFVDFAIPVDMNPLDLARPKTAGKAPAAEIR
ncbi:MAG TPA: thiol-disulfide isomerase [Bryobacteraceae bacterium]|nr:thiol-disulfide isomerase [Bryobacteraceae bacterium]